MYMYVHTAVTVHRLKAGFCMPQLMLYDTIPIIQLYPGVKFSTNFSETFPWIILFAKPYPVSGKSRMQYMCYTAARIQ